MAFVLSSLQGKESKQVRFIPKASHAGSIVSVHVPIHSEPRDASHTTPTSILVHHRHVYLEGLLLHAQVQPRGRQRLLFHTRVFLPRAFCQLPSATVAVWYFQRPHREKPSDGSDRAPVPGGPRHHAAGSRPSHQDPEGGPQSVVTGQHCLETVASDVLLTVRPVLPVWPRKTGQESKPLAVRPGWPWAAPALWEPRTLVRWPPWFP